MSDLPNLTASRTRSAWVGALSAGQENNWEICKEKSLWGSGANTAREVREGDEFFVWQSGQGWFALDPMFHPGSQNNRQNITGIPNIRLGQFPRLSTEESNAVRSFFGLTNPPQDNTDIEIERENDQHENEIMQRTLEGSLERERLVGAFDVGKEFFDEMLSRLKLRAA